MADTVYRALRTERRDQAVMISGESGAGKTEATKRLLQFYAETCPAPERGGAVRDRLLQSNPVLEVRGLDGSISGKGRRKCQASLTFPSTPRPLEMPRLSATITPAGSGSTWMCSLTSRYCGWSEALGVVGLAIQSFRYLFSVYCVPGTLPVTAVRAVKSVLSPGVMGDKQKQNNLSRSRK